MGDQRGYMQVPMGGLTLIGILATIAAASILLGRAAETWDSQVRHELELTLIARGEEYQRAIDEYRRVNGTLPMKLEDLCPKQKADVRYIRRCWKDPITGKDFHLLTLAEVGQRAAMRRQKEEEDGEASGTAGGARDRGSNEREGPSMSDVRWTMPGQASKIEFSGDQPFVGVASDSDREGFRAWNGSTVYNEWEFVAQSALQPAAAIGPGQAGTMPGGVPGGVPGGGPGGVPGSSGQMGGQMGGGLGGAVVPPRGGPGQTQTPPRPFPGQRPTKPGFPGPGFPQRPDQR